ncbi:MAG: hypothetical protein J7L88_01155 [Thermoplasmata archaeon]|nr:hypothetical protein [Thermoplasmata archaeon]
MLRVHAERGAFGEIALETILSDQIPNNPKEKEHFKKELLRDYEKNSIKYQDYQKSNAPLNV